MKGHTGWQLVGDGLIGGTIGAITGGLGSMIGTGISAGVRGLAGGLTNGIKSFGSGMLWEGANIVGGLARGASGAFGKTANGLSSLTGGVKSLAYEAKRLINVPRAWLDNRSLARSLNGDRPEPNATIRDLLDFRPGNPQRPEKLALANAREDGDLMNSVFAPHDQQFVATNSSMPNTILQGNHRVYQLLRRAADPENTEITYDTPIFINRGQ